MIFAMNVLCFCKVTSKLFTPESLNIYCQLISAPRISRQERIRNVTIRQQIGLEETIIKEIEQNQLTWYGYVQRMAEKKLPKITLQWMPKQKRARGRPKKTGWKVHRRP